MSRWPIVKLEEVLRLDLDTVSVVGTNTYPMAGVLSYARGLFEREDVQGGSSSYKNFYKLHEGQLVLSQLFGWEGALAMVSSTFAGRYVSSQFPTFRPFGNRIHPAFIGWCIQRSNLWEQLKGKAKGMGDRRRTLNPANLLSCEIALPPIAEQKSIVAQLDAMTELSGKVDVLREEIAAELSMLVVVSNRSYSQGRLTRFGDAIFLDEDRVIIEPGVDYPQIGIKGFGGGLFAKSPVRAEGTTYRYFNRLHEGQFVVSQVKGWEGAVAVCSEQYAGFFVSPEYRTFRCNPEMLRPSYLAFLCRTAWFHSFLATLTRGQGARRERLRPEMLVDAELPLPTIADQERLENAFRKADKARSLASTASLEGLLPSLLDCAFNGETADEAVVSIRNATG